MPRLVRQREDMLDHVLLEVHEDVGIGVEGAGAEGPRSLAGVRIAVAPAAAQALLQAAAVLSAQRLERLDYQLHRRVPCVPLLELRHQRHVAVVVMDRVEPQDPLPQVVVAVHDREVGTDGRDQLVIDRQRDVVGEQGRLDRGWVVADAGRIDVALVGARERGRERVRMGLVLVVELVECRPADVRHRVVEERRERGVRELDPLPLAGRDTAELEIGVGELAKHLPGGAGERALHGQQLLLRLRKRVGPGADDPLEHEAIRCEHRQVHPRGELRRVDGHDLGPDEARRLARPRGNVLKPADHPLGCGRRLVLAGPQMRVRAEPVPLAVERQVVLQALGEPLRRRPQRARIGRELPDAILPGREPLLPLRIGAAQAREVPGVADRNVLPGRQSLFNAGVAHGHFFRGGWCLFEMAVSGCSSGRNS